MSRLKGNERGLRLTTAVATIGGAARTRVTRPRVASVVSHARLHHRQRARRMHGKHDPAHFGFCS